MNSSLRVTQICPKWTSFPNGSIKLYKLPKLKFQATDAYNGLPEYILSLSLETLTFIYFKFSKSPSTKDKF